MSGKRTKPAPDSASPDPGQVRREIPATGGRFIRQRDGSLKPVQTPAETPSKEA